MNRIIPPLKTGMRGPKVHDVHAALRLCLERGVIAVDEPVRLELLQALEPELARQVFGDITQRLVGMFQEARVLPTTGEVDEPTADAFNGLLREWGMLDRDDEDDSRVVTGSVRREDGLPLAGLRVRATHDADLRAIRLGQDTTDADGSYTIRYQPLPKVETLNLRVSALAEDGSLLASSGVIRDPGPVEGIDLVVASGEPSGGERRVEGRLLLQRGRPAEGVTLRLYRREFGGATTRLAETTTLAGGAYSLPYDPGGTAASLEVRAVIGGAEEVSLSDGFDDDDRAPRAAVNLIAPGSVQRLAPEYGRLVADLTPHVGEIARLGGAEESAERQDLTVLNRATGWDARLIALAAVAQRLSTEPTLGLPPEALYGLLRAGLPAEKRLLAQVEPEVVAKALTAVRDTGVIALSDDGIVELTGRFADFAAATRLGMPAPGALSSYGDLLEVSGLNNDDQARFASTFLGHRGDADALWTAAREGGLAETQVRTLQLQGKLAFLAGNSAAMTGRLMSRGLGDPVELVGQDLHRADSWTDEVFEAAGIPEDRRGDLTEADRQALQAVIPSSFTAENVEDALAMYADDMARKVRLSYPTHVVTRLVERGEIVLPKAQDATVTLLRNAAAQGLRLGQTPVTTFLRARPGVIADMAPGDVAVAEEQLRLLHCTYQLTPSDEALPVLIQLGITASPDVLEYSEAQFDSLYRKKYGEIHGTFPESSEPRLIYRKAEQVSSITYNLFTAAGTFEAQPQVAAVAAPTEVRESVRDALIRQFPTLESLFGSMDFCACAHCRSVLSPAAYLVDLLQFVDADPSVWANFLEQWKSRHKGQGYPHTGADGRPVTPYEVLLERRPDLPHVALTCENTQTAMPYIDIANEILEYYVAHGRLANAAAYDTGEATTAELLAEPQNVVRDAYTLLADARYPLGLPFDLWIETARELCDHVGTPLARLLHVFRPTDDLFAPAKPFDRASVFIESLGLSPAEAALFADPDPLTGDAWHRLYGLPSVRPAIQAPTNAGHATLTIPNADAAAFAVGLACTYLAAGTNAMSAETKTITAIGAPDSGGGGRALVTFSGIWTNAPAAGDLLVCAGPATLRSAKALSRRLGVSYEEITQIVRGGFVNPRLPQLAILYKLGVAISDVRFYLDHRGLIAQDPATLSTEDKKRRLEARSFRERLDSLATTFAVPQATLEAALEAVPFDRVLVLADPDAGCDFDLTTLRYADGAPADAIVFLRINLFVRLWRNLGWTIEETDRALHAFVPASAPYEPANLAKQPLVSALIYLAHLKELDERLRLGKRGRMRLVALWSDIATTGKEPLYAQLFLTRSVLRAAPVFDDPLGRYLSQAGVKLRDHLLAVQGALGLTADDVRRILDDAGTSLAAADLSLPVLSTLYRHGLLAKALKLSVRELIVLKQLSGLDPFTPLHPDPLADSAPGVVPPTKAIELDHPLSQTLRFVEVAGEVKESRLSIDDLDYLLRHRFDPTGPYRPDRAATLALLQALADGVRAIRAEHAVSADLADEALAQKLALALPSEVVGRFLAMMGGTAEFTSTATGIDPGAELSAKELAGEPVIREVRYNAARREQTLTVVGVLFEEDKAALIARHPPSALLAGLLDDAQEQARAYFETHLQERAPGLQPAGGFLKAADYALLFDLNRPLEAGETPDDRARARRATLARAFLPYLQQRLISQLVVETMAAQTGADAGLVERLLGDARLLDGPGPLLGAFAASGERGVTAAFFDSADATGQAQETTPVLASADTALKDTADPSGSAWNAAGSARFEGYLRVPEPGAYRFFVSLAEQGAEAELRFDHLPDPLFWSGVAAVDDDELGGGATQYLELQPGVLYRFQLLVRKLNAGRARLSVQGETLPKGPLSQLTLSPSGAIDGADRAALLLAKALRVVQSAALTEREVRHLLTHPQDFGGLSLSELPIRASGDTPDERAAARRRFAGFLHLAAYVRLRDELAGGTEGLIDIFEANATSDPNRLTASVYPLIARLSRRDAATVESTATTLFPAPDFSGEGSLRRLWQALQVVERYGAPGASLEDWTEIVGQAVTPARRFEIARDMKAAISARLEPETWRRVAQPIFDRLRARQRDALVSHVMHRRGFARREQLYEHFLIDPGMEPVVQTSRIRLAIASVQLFIQRCLLNLEPRVDPSTINAGRWEWMKRYRVWEANRKIFLFPENWLEPEFRDDKTHLYAELEGALLQGDVSADLAEDAFLAYLRKLDELARLDIVAMHLEDDPDPGRRRLHVIGRTYGRPHKHFYRRYANRAWTPWEPVSAEIAGDHLAPVIWRDRLYLFWVTFADRADPKATPGTAGGSKLGDATLSEVMTGLAAAAANKYVDVELHWSEHLQGQWTTHESGGPATSIPALVSAAFDPRSVFLHVSVDYDGAGEERGVRIHLGGTINKAFHLAGRNSAPEAATRDTPPDNPFASANTVRASRYAGGAPLTVRFTERVGTEASEGTSVTTATILPAGGGYTLLPCDNHIPPLGVSHDAYKKAGGRPGVVKAAIESGLAEITSLTKPVFYQDNTHTLFVEPSVVERTVQEWQEWVTPPPPPESTPRPEEGWVIPDIYVEIPYEVPFPVPEPEPWWIDVHDAAVINPLPKGDWLVNQTTALLYDDALVGPGGRVDAAILPAGELAPAGLAVNVNPAAGLAAGAIVVLTGATKLVASGLAPAEGGLNVIGSAGLNPALAKNLQDLGQSFGAIGGVLSDG